MSLFTHNPHPHVEARKDQAPVTVAEQGHGWSGRLALRITAMVGTMGAAALFTLLALVALPSVLGLSLFPPRTLLIVGWVSQTLIQLVMLAILQLGQNLQASAADKRAEATYADAEAILHEALEIHAHLEAQDAVLKDLHEDLNAKRG